MLGVKCRRPLPGRPGIVAECAKSGPLRRTTTIGAGTPCRFPARGPPGLLGLGRNHFSELVRENEGRLLLHVQITGELNAAMPLAPLTKIAMARSSRGSAACGGQKCCRLDRDRARHGLSPRHPRKGPHRSALLRHMITDLDRQIVRTGDIDLTMLRKADPSATLTPTPLRYWRAIALKMR